MKKIILIASLVILSSCKNSSNRNSILDSIFSSNETPKCDDKQVTETVTEILIDNVSNLIHNNGRGGVFLIPKDTKIKNIITRNANNELKSCNCEGTVMSGFNSKSYRETGNVSYTVQKNSEGEVIISVDNAGPFEFSF